MAKISVGVQNQVAGLMKTIFQGGKIGIFSGGQPSDPSQAETGNLLVVISSSSGTGGITFGTAGAGVMPKDSGVWSGLCGTAGIAGWFRMYTSDMLMGSNGTANRIDGNVGVSGADMVMSNTNLVQGATQTIDTATMTEAAS